MRAGNQQILLILAVFFGVLCALSPPTFGDSFSGFETSDARQILANAQAKRVAEAAKQNALISFVISLVICYVMFPINDQRLLKVVIVIGVTTIGYFGGQWIEEGKGIATDPMLAAEERADALKAKSQFNEAAVIMQLTGLDVSGLKQVKYSVDWVQQLKQITLSSKNVRAFQDQLYDFVPTLQSLVDEIAQNSISMAEFDSKFGGMGKRLLSEIGDITGADYNELRGRVESTIRDRTIRLPSDKALAAQDAADQLFEWGYSEPAMAPQGGLQNLPMLRAEIMVVRDAQEKVRAAETAKAAIGIIAREEGEALGQKRKDIDKKGQTADEITQGKAVLKSDIGVALEASLGIGNVDSDMIAKGYEALTNGGDAYIDFVKSEKKRLAHAGNIEIDHSQLDRVKTELIAGGLTEEQVQRLLDDTKHYVAVRQRIAELNYALGGIKDHAGVQSAGGIRAIVDRKAEQTKSTPQKNP
jgi:hypothetical protein